MCWVFPFNVTYIILLKDRIVALVEFGAWGGESRNIINFRATHETQKMLDVFSANMDDCIKYDQFCQFVKLLPRNGCRH